MADQELVILNQTTEATSNEGKIFLKFWLDWYFFLSFQKLGEKIEFSKSKNEFKCAMEDSDRFVRWFHELLFYEFF